MAKVKFKIGDQCRIISNTLSSHGFDVGDIVSVFRLTATGNMYDVCRKINGDCYWVYNKDLELITKDKKQTSMKLMKKAVLDTASKLAKANNTVTTLELKLELRKTHPFFHWIQNTRNGLIGVSEFMEQLAQEGRFTYTDTVTSGNTHRVYSLATTPVTVTIPKRVVKTKRTTSKNTMKSTNRNKALDMIRGNKGHFFTVIFTKLTDGTVRTMNCQYLSDSGGYVKVRESNKLKNGTNPIRQFDIETVKQLRIAGQDLKIRK